MEIDNEFIEVLKKVLDIKDELNNIQDNINFDSTYTCTNTLEEELKKEFADFKANKIMKEIKSILNEKDSELPHKDDEDECNCPCDSYENIDILSIYKGRLIQMEEAYESLLDKYKDLIEENTLLKETLED